MHISENPGYNNHALADRGRSDLTVRHLADLRYARQGTCLAYCGVLVPVPMEEMYRYLAITTYAYDES